MTRRELFAGGISSLITPPKSEAISICSHEWKECDSALVVKGVFVVIESTKMQQDVEVCKKCGLLRIPEKDR